MRYEKVLTLPASTIKHLRHITESRFDDRSAMPMGEDDVESYLVTFDDDTVMDLRFCGVEFEEGSDNAAYTEALLIREDTSIALSDPSDFAVDDEWELSDDDGNVYVVTIVPQVMSNEEFMHYAQANYNCAEYAFLIRNVLDYLRDNNTFVDSEKAVKALMEIFNRIGFGEDELYMVADGWDYNA